MSHHNSSNASRLKIARHPEVVTMYRIMRGPEVLVDSIQSLDEALMWQSIWAGIVETTLKPLTSRESCT